MGCQAFFGCLDRDLWDWGAVGGRLEDWKVDGGTVVCLKQDLQDSWIFRIGRRGLDVSSFLVKSGVVSNRTIGVNLGIFDNVLTTDINMPPLQGLDLCSDTLL